MTMASLGEWAVHNAGLVALIVLSYVVGGALHRLYFSPLATFPGPKLAALTVWYEFYYDVLKRGQYLFEIRKMHEQYGLCAVHYHVATLSNCNCVSCSEARLSGLVPMSCISAMQTTTKSFTPDRP